MNEIITAPQEEEPIYIAPVAKDESDEVPVDILLKNYLQVNPTHITEEIVQSLFGLKPEEPGFVCLQSFVSARLTKLGYEDIATAAKTTLESQYCCVDKGLPPQPELLIDSSDLKSEVSTAKTVSESLELLPGKDSSPQPEVDEMVAVTAEESCNKFMDEQAVILDSQQPLLTITESVIPDELTITNSVIPDELTITDSVIVDKSPEPPITDLVIVNNIKKIATQYGDDTRYKFMKRTGLSPTTAYTLYDDPEAYPSKAAMLVICRTYGCSPGDILSVIPE